MNALHILDHSLPLHSGYAFRSESIMAAQKARGWHPLALTSPKHFRTNNCASGVETIDGIAYHRSGRARFSRLPLFTEISLMLRLRQKICRVAKLANPDLIHAHSPLLNCLPALQAGRQLDIPVVYEIRAFWEDAGVDHGTYAHNSLKYRLVRALETWACRKAAHVFVICQGLKDDLEQRGIPPHKISVAPNGIDTARFQPCPPDAEFRERWNLGGKTVIGFIGSFYRYEGLDLLLKSFASLSGHKPELRLLLAGGGPLQDELAANARSLAIEDKVIMPGRLPHDRIPGIYALTDILVFPRHAMRLTDLVTPLKPLEAMAMGKPLIASDVGGHRELIRHGETGLLFGAGNASMLASTMTSLIDDVSLRNKIGRTDREWVNRERAWAKTAEVYASIYPQVLNSH